MNRNLKSGRIAFNFAADTQGLCYKYGLFFNVFKTTIMKSKVNFIDSLKSGLFAGIASILVNVTLFFFFKALGFITEDILVNGMPMTALIIIIASFVPSLIGGMVFFGMNKFLNVSFSMFAIISIVLLSLSMINPFVMIPNVTIAYAISLDLLHVPVALFLLYFLQKVSK